jgi:hypothetical protein
MIPSCFSCYSCFTYRRRHHPSIIIKNSFRFVLCIRNISNITITTILKGLTVLFDVPSFPALSHIRSHQFRAIFPSLYQHTVKGLYSNLRDLGKCTIYLQSKSAKQTFFINIKKVDDSELYSEEIYIASLIGSERIQVSDVEHPRGDVPWGLIAL